MVMKKCSKCGVEKDFSEFYKHKKAKDGLIYHCKSCIKDYYKYNKDKIKIKQKAYRETNKEAGRAYYQANKEKIKAYKRRRIRSKTEPLYRMSHNIRSNTSRVFKKKGFSKDCKVVDIVGGSWQVCKEHIEKQFTKGMGWENYGEWHIDHIIPLSSANTKDGLVKICHYSNLQPLWAKDNLSKGSKIL